MRLCPEPIDSTVAGRLRGGLDASDHGLFLPAHVGVLALVVSLVSPRPVRDSPRSVSSMGHKTSWCAPQMAGLPAGKLHEVRSGHMASPLSAAPRTGTGEWRLRGGSSPSYHPTIVCTRTPGQDLSWPGGQVPGREKSGARSLIARDLAPHALALLPSINRATRSAGRWPPPLSCWRPQAWIGCCSRGT